MHKKYPICGGLEHLKRERETLNKSHVKSHVYFGIVYSWECSNTQMAPLFAPENTISLKHNGDR
jgi:hypothetical protein